MYINAEEVDETFNQANAKRQDLRSEQSYKAVEAFTERLKYLASFGTKHPLPYLMPYDEFVNKFVDYKMADRFFMFGGYSVNECWKRCGFLHLWKRKMVRIVRVK